MSLLERSKQIWKLKLFISLMAIGAVITLSQSFLVGHLGKELTMQLGIGGMILIVAIFIWAGDNIVCPKCSLKLLYYAITKVGLGTWYEWLRNEEKCPKCSYNGDSTVATKENKKGRGKR